MTEIFEYTPEKFQLILNRFQKFVEAGTYTSKIPYDIWRKLKKLRNPKIEYTSPFVKICEVDVAGQDIDIFTAETYDWGFGRFFYDYFIKKENDRKMNKVLKVDLDCSKQCTGADLYVKSNSNWDPIGEVINSATNAIITSNGTVWEHGCCDGASTNTATTGTYPYYLGTINTLEDRVNQLEAEVQKKADKVENNTTKENNKMKGFNFEFGSCSGDNVRMSMYGLAVKNSAGSWVSFNPNTYNIVDVEIMNFDGGKYLYKMPTAIRDIQVGDVIIHCRKPMFVSGINEKSLIAIDPVDGEVKEIMPTTSPFGFNFVTKIVNLFASYMTAPTADQPFGNMLPFMLMSGESGKDIDPMMLMLMMNQNGTGMMSNLMPMCLMMKDRKDIDPLMLMALYGSFNSAPAHPHVCHCGKHTEQEAEANN